MAAENIIEQQDNVQNNRQIKRREQCKVNQRRYRARKQCTNAKTEQDIKELKQDVARLNGKLGYLKIYLFHPEQKFVQEYFDIFANGMCLINKPKQIYQETFLHSMMTNDLYFMNQFGVEKIIEQLQLYSTVYAKVRTDGISHRVLLWEPHVIMCTTFTIHLRISRLTLETVFPHILSNEFLMQKLIGKELHLKSTALFAFNEHHQVFQLDSKADFMGGMLKLLDDIDQTELVLSGANLDIRTAEITQTMTKPEKTFR